MIEELIPNADGWYNIMDTAAKVNEIIDVVNQLATGVGFCPEPEIYSWQETGPIA